MNQSDYQSYPSGENNSPAAQPVMVPVQLPVIKPLVTFVFIGLCAAVFILQQASTFLFSYDYPLLFGAKINEAIVAGQFWRLITPAFLHGSILHIGFNLYALYIIGPGLERFYGHMRYGMLVVISALLGNVFSFLLAPYVSVGASTAVFGLVVAEAVFIYRNRNLYGKRGRTMLVNSLSIIAINLFLGFTSNGVDNWGHLGGLLGGLGFAWFAGPILRVVAVPFGYEAMDSRSESSAWTTFAILGLAAGALVLLGLNLSGSGSL